MSGFSSAACGTSDCDSDSSTSDTSGSSIDDCNRSAKKRRRSAKVDRSTDERTAWARTGWSGHVAAKLRENSWYDYYHMPLESFKALHQLLFHETQEQKEMARVKALNSTRMGEIETEVKLAATLRQLYGEKKKSMVDVFKISPTSCRAAFMDVIARINKCKVLEGRIYSTDHSVEVLERRAAAFATRSLYPTIFRHAVGAIDGLFIRTHQPKAKEVGNVRTYWSGHKKAFGLNMQGVCDAQCRFIGFSCNTPGSTNDYVAYRHSFVYGLWPDLPSPFYYLGDCAYPLSPFCVTPYIGTTLSVADDAFNFYHSQLRITIERAFGIFVGVFGTFHTPLTCSVKTTCEIVEACVRLHNFRIDQGCQHVTRTRSCIVSFKQSIDRSSDVFDVLDDCRYVTERPHATDAAYGQYVALQEGYSGSRASDAVFGQAKRNVLTHALSQMGAARPQPPPQ